MEALEKLTNLKVQYNASLEDPATEATIAGEAEYVAKEYKKWVANRNIIQSQEQEKAKTRAISDGGQVKEEFSLS